MLDCSLRMIFVLLVLLHFDWVILKFIGFVILEYEPIFLILELYFFLSCIALFFLATYNTSWPISFDIFCSEFLPKFYYFINFITSNSIFFFISLTFTKYSSFFYTSTGFLCLLYFSVDIFKFFKRIDFNTSRPRSYIIFFVWI